MEEEVVRQVGETTIDSTSAMLSRIDNLFIQANQASATPGYVEVWNAILNSIYRELYPCMTEEDRKETQEFFRAPYTPPDVINQMSDAHLNAYSNNRYIHLSKFETKLRMIYNRNFFKKS